MLLSALHRTPLAVAAVVLALLLPGCGGGGSDNSSAAAASAPVGVGFADSALVQSETSVLPYVDFGYTNQRGDARYATKDTNAGVRVVSGFLDLWTPSTLLVDAGTSATANGSFPAVVASNWTGIPGDATDGKAANQTVLQANIQYVIDATRARTAAQATAAYFDDRRQKGYSVADGMGPLTTAWRAATQQTTTINSIPADATSVLYNDGGNNLGVGSSTNANFGTVVDFLNVQNDGSTEPAKRFFKYARPWRWSSSVIIVPELIPAKGSTPTTDGGFISGHAAEATRDALLMAYVVPERFQELISRGLELGENRILSGMHSPLDVIGGRIQAQAVIAATLYAQSIQSKSDATNGSRTAVKDLRKTAYDQAHTSLMAAVAAADQAAFNAYAHSGTPSTDRFADYATNKANYLRRLTLGFAQIADKTKPAVVPKGAELLLETRQPYLDSAQRRVVLKTTALPSGYPVMDDAEGWGRLNLFAAADGYGAFNGDVSVVMDASLGGFNALDSWKNDISGNGKLTKSGSGTLRLTGNNSFGGGTQLNGGILEAGSSTAFGLGDLYVAAGTLVSSAASAVSVGRNYTQLAGTTLQLSLGANNKRGALDVGGSATLGGTLQLKFVGGYKPAIGDTLNIISAGALKGAFTVITVDGFKASAIYSATGMQVHIDG